MTLAAVAGASFALGFSGAVMPGPLLTVTVAESVRRGPAAGPLLIAGHALLEAVVVAALLLGPGELLARPPIFAAVALIGGAVLLWMGAVMLRTLPSLRLELDASAPPGLHPVAAGALVSLANPYFTLWWATVGLGYLAVAREAGVAGVVVFYLFHILSDFVWYAFVSKAVTCGRRFLTDRSYRLLVGGCALFVLAFGLYFGYRGLHLLLA